MLRASVFLYDGQAVVVVAYPDAAETVLHDGHDVALGERGASVAVVPAGCGVVVEPQTVLGEYPDKAFAVGIGRVDQTGRVLGSGHTGGAADARCAAVEKHHVAVHVDVKHASLPHVGQIAGLGAAQQAVGVVDLDSHLVAAVIYAVALYGHPAGAVGAESHIGGSGLHAHGTVNTVNAAVEAVERGVEDGIGASGAHPYAAVGGAHQILDVAVVERGGIGVVADVSTHAVSIVAVEPRGRAEIDEAFVVLVDGVDEFARQMHVGRKVAELIAGSARESTRTGDDTYYIYNESDLHGM